jgi:AraC-like DNA-binding protein
MYAGAADRSRIEPSASAASALSALFVDEHTRDTPAMAIPRPEVQLVARFGPLARGGVDVHVMGVREKVHRKLLRGGQRSVTARLRLGAPEAVLGVRASELRGGIVSIDQLWGGAATRRLVNQLEDARSAADAAAVLDGAIAERIATAEAGGTRAKVVEDAARRLTDTNVAAVAAELRVSERHLRRIFNDVVGVSPKAFARLARFHRALSAARRVGSASWAGIATAAGYYDQAHLIAEFRAFAGTTPQALLDELGAALAFGC